MSNIHVLTRNGVGFDLVYHIPVNAGNNGAGIAYATAVTRSNYGGTTILPLGDGTGGTIDATEKASITAGTLVERRVTLDITQGGSLTTAGQIGTYLDQQFSAITTEIQAEIVTKLQHYGRVR